MTAQAELFVIGHESDGLGGCVVHALYAQVGQVGGDGEASGDE